MAKLLYQFPLRLACVAALAVCSVGPALADGAPGDQPDQRPLSPAQVALFETPHLQNVSQPETLDYQFVREGPDAFSDKVAVHVRDVNADGTKDLSFDFLTGDHKVPYPELDKFRGNPLLMIVLERDVQQMKTSLGVSATYFRNHVREAFVDEATVGDTQFMLDGKMVPARVVTVHPFAKDDRLEKLPSVQAKTYAFVLADAVPGTLAEIRIDTPADASKDIPAVGERVTFEGVEK